MAKGKLVKEVGFHQYEELIDKLEVLQRLQAEADLLHAKEWLDATMAVSLLISIPIAIAVSWFYINPLINARLLDVYYHTPLLTVMIAAGVASLVWRMVGFCIAFAIPMALIHVISDELFIRLHVRRANAKNG